VTHKQILDWIAKGRTGPIREWIQRSPLAVYVNEPLRSVANRMAEHRITRAPVVDPEEPGLFAGMVSLRDLLHARAQNVKDERHQERVLNLRLIS